MDTSLSPLCADAVLGWGPGHVLPPTGTASGFGKMTLGGSGKAAVLQVLLSYSRHGAQMRLQMNGFPSSPPPKKLVCAGNSGWGLLVGSSTAGSCGFWLSAARGCSVEDGTLHHGDGAGLFAEAPRRPGSWFRAASLPEAVLRPLLGFPQLSLPCSKTWSAPTLPAAVHPQGPGIHLFLTNSL